LKEFTDQVFALGPRDLEAEAKAAEELKKKAAEERAKKAAEAKKKE
jgi:hypothetical protein